MGGLTGVPRTDFHWKASPGKKEALLGKRIAIIGGTKGIGRAVARQLAAYGAEVTVVGRTFADQDIKQIRFIPADLSSLKKSLEVADQLLEQPPEICLLTTGIVAAKTRQETSEGIETDLAVSYLCRYVIVKRLVEKYPSIEREVKPRFFIMGFPGADMMGNVDDFNSELAYKGMQAHSNTVAGNEALVLHSAKSYPQAGFYGLNPGLIKTTIRSTVLGNGIFSKIVEGIIGLLFPSADQYAEKLLALLNSPVLENYSGAIFNRHLNPIQPSKNLQDEESVDRIISESEKLCEPILRFT